MSRSSEEVLRHYEQSGLLLRILAGLKALGKDLQQRHQRHQGQTRMALTLAFWGDHVCECTREHVHVVG